MAKLRSPPHLYYACLFSFLEPLIRWRSLNKPLYTEGRVCLAVNAGFRLRLPYGFR